jgi:hypothetical protein
MATLDSVTGKTRDHWELHLKMALADCAVGSTNREQVYKWLSGQSDLPNLKHPSDLHDWLEYPEKRAFLEAHGDLIT